MIVKKISLYALLSFPNDIHLKKLKALLRGMSKTLSGAGLLL